MNAKLSEKAEKRAAALRDNLKRRKQKAKAERQQNKEQGAQDQESTQTKDA